MDGLFVFYALAQVATYAGATKRTDYAGEFIYENDVLQFINHEEGRIVVSGEKLLLSDGCENTGNKTASNATLATYTANDEEYVKVTANGTTIKTGVFAIGGSFPVTPGERYRIRAKGYRTGANAVYLLIKANTTDLGWPGAALPDGAGAEALIEQIVTIPAGTSTLQAGIAWNTVTAGQIFYLNEFEIVQITTVTPEYQYHLKDHLGNVRVTFTSKEDLTDTYTATLENNTQAEEQATFKNYSRVTADVYDHTDAGTAYDKAQLLNGGYNSQVGLTKSFAVMPGDVVDVEVYAKYFETTGGSGNLSGFAAALLSAFGLPTPVGGETGTAAAALQDYGAFIAGGGNSGTSGWPKGWLNMLVFDKDYNLVDLAFEQVDAAFGQPVGNPNKLPMQQLTLTKTIKEPGYVYIYLSNEGNVQQDIYFDDLTITHEKSRVLQMDDYYPFGLTFNSSRRENSVANAYQYNGKEMQDELGLGILDYGARMYMSDIGRWGVIDPLAEKARRWSPYAYVYDNPLRFIDPDGMEGMGINLTTGGSMGEGNAAEHRRWMDERESRWAKRRVGVGSYSGSSEMEQTVQDKPQYWGSQPAPGVAGGTKRKKKKAEDAQQGGPGRFFTKEGDAYTFMWNSSFGADGKVQQEVAAFLTPKGVLVLPTEGKRTNGEYAKNGPRRSYNDFLPLSRKDGNVFVAFNGSKYQVLGQVHTHPNAQPFESYEVASDLVTQNFLGVPVYMIRTDGFYNTSGTVLGTQLQFFNGTKSLIGGK